MSQEIRSTISGVVTSIKVQIGEVVNDGQDLIVLEAMKMEFPIQATAKGTVKEININEGDTVNEEAIMLIIE